jgi:YVTN family beta-propeller protein
VTGRGEAGRVTSSPVHRRPAAAVFVVAASLIAASCSSGSHGPSATTSGSVAAQGTSTTAAGATNVYAHDMAGDWSPNLSPGVIAHPMVYVPDSDTNTVDVIDPATFKIVHHYVTGSNPQHVAPSYDLSTLYVDNDLGNSLTPINPATGLPSGPNIRVEDPYNMYFTTDGSMAIVVCEALHQLDFRDPKTFALIKTLPVPLPINGIDHLDFSADGSYAIMSAEYSGDVVKIDIRNQAVVGSLHVGGSPVDVKLSPDGKVFYVANQQRDGVSIIDGETMQEIGFIPTGTGAHGLYPSRDARYLYVSNRGDPKRKLPGQGVSVISFATNTVVAHWMFSGSPDMGGVSPDGSQLWLSGRYNAEVYVIDTKTGHLLARIPTGPGPHGLDYFPQPGRYSIGHTGNYR